MLTRPAAALMALAGLAAFAPHGAEGAPQILGLVASSGLPTPMRCAGGTCTAILASFCLEEHRMAPHRGQAYAPAPGGGLTLVATRADGGRRRIPAAALLTLTTRSGFSTVEASLPEATLAALGDRDHTVAVALEVAPETALVPVTASADADPQDADAIAAATGPLRRIAATFFDRPGPDADTARLVGLLRNALPSDGDGSAVALEPLLNHLVAGVDGTGRGGAGLARVALDEAQRIAHACEIFVDAPTSRALGTCLEEEEVGVLSFLNQRFWAAAAGS